MHSQWYNAINLNYPLYENGIVTSSLFAHNTPTTAANAAKPPLVQSSSPAKASTSMYAIMVYHW